MECERRNKMDIEIKDSTIEDLSHNKKDGGLKSDFRVIDALIDSMAYELSEVRDELNRMRSEMRILRNQYERLKKEYKESQEKADNIETFDMEFEYCPHCDSKIYAHNDYEYCPYCGKELD